MVNCVFTTRLKPTVALSLHHPRLQLREGRMPAGSVTKTPIDRSKTYVCRFSCGFETTWPAARGRHEAARHKGHAPAHATARSISGTGTPAKMDRLLDELGKQHDEVLQALKKTSLLVLAERDLRAHEAQQIKTDLSAIYEVLERNRRTVSSG